MAINFERVKKNYGKKPVFYDLNFKIPLEPTVIGLVGPNGVGKSTMLRLLAGVLEPTEGIIKNDGKLQAKQKSRHILINACFFKYIKLAQ